MLRIGDRVEMRDRYRRGIHRFEPSWFDGMRGRVTQVRPYVMVLIDSERLAMRFDERDFVPEEPNQASMTGAE